MEEHLILQTLDWFDTLIISPFITSFPKESDGVAYFTSPVFERLMLELTINQSSFDLDSFEYTVNSRVDGVDRTKNGFLSTDQLNNMLEDYFVDWSDLEEKLLDGQKIESRIEDLFE